MPASPEEPPDAASPPPEGIEVEDLWREFKETGSEELRNALIERYYPLVRQVAQRLKMGLPNSVQLDDLVGAGTFGLLNAIERYDPNRGVRFKTYCSLRVRGSILDDLRKQDWVPRAVRIKAGAVNKAMEKLRAEHGREPTDYELAQALGMELEDLAKELDASKPMGMFSLTGLVGTGDADDGPPAPQVADEKVKAPSFDLERSDLMDRITQSLNEKERQILVLYYREQMTLRDIGEALGLTESRICQIHSNIMARLRRSLDRIQSELV